MNTENLPDSDGSKTHKMVEVVQYEFFINAHKKRTLAYTLKDGTEITEQVLANVYVMNDTGKTINSFHLPTS